MAKAVNHMVRVRPGAFGGTLTTSLCGRLRTVADGMNLTQDAKRVTCALCIRKLPKPELVYSRHLTTAEGANDALDRCDDVMEQG